MTWTGEDETAVKADEKLYVNEAKGWVRTLYDHHNLGTKLFSAPNDNLESGRVSRQMQRKILEVALAWPGCDAATNRDLIFTASRLTTPERRRIFTACEDPDLLRQHDGLLLAVIKLLITLHKNPSAWKA